MLSFKIVVVEPVGKGLVNLLLCFVAMSFDCLLLNESVDSFNEPIGLGRIGSCGLVHDAGGVACGLKVRPFAFGVSGRRHAFERVLASVVSKDGMDPEREELLAAGQEVAGGFAIVVVIDSHEDRTRGSIDGHEAVLTLGVSAALLA